MIPVIHGSQDGNAVLQMVMHVFMQARIRMSVAALKIKFQFCLLVISTISSTIIENKQFATFCKYAYLTLFSFCLSFLCSFPKSLNNHTFQYHASSFCDQNNHDYNCSHNQAALVWLRHLKPFWPCTTCIDMFYLSLFLLYEVGLFNSCDCILWFVIKHPVWIKYLMTVCQVKIVPQCVLDTYFSIGLETAVSKH